MVDEHSGRSSWRRPRGGTYGAATARRSLRYYVHPHRARVVLIGTLTVVQSLLGLVPVLVVKALVDDLQHPKGSFGRIGVLVALGAGLIAATGLVGVLRSWLVLTVRTSVIADLRQEIAGCLLHQSVGFYTHSRGGELMSRMLNDVTVVDSMFDALLLAGGGSVTALGCIVVMLLLEWHLALLTLFAIPPLVLSLRLAGGPIYRSRLEVQERLAALTVHLQERMSLSGIMLIKSFGREEAEGRRIAGLNQTLRRSEVDAGMTASWVSLGLNLLQFAGPAVLLLAGAWLVVHDNVSLGTLVAFITVLGLRFGSSVFAMGNGVVAVIGALPAWARIFELLDDSVEIEERPDAVELVDVRGAVHFDAVTFTYPARRHPALHGASIDIAPGQLVALVGPSGAGKSTLCSLVPRFYDPQDGVVRIDGRDVRALTLASLGQVTGLVFQDTYLFHDTLRHNLLYPRPDATTEELDAACADAQLQDVISALPEGLDTVVGERGHRLSGGEKQRVAIARVILKDPPVLILDEATSHLDSVSEALVQKALARLFDGRTSLVIAHRLSTVLAADLIVVLDGGRVVERGTHAKLVTAGGLYSVLYETQFRPGQTKTIPA